MMFLYYQIRKKCEHHKVKAKLNMEIRFGNNKRWIYLNTGDRNQSRKNERSDNTALVG